MLGDEGINLICGLLPPDGAKSGKHQEPWAAQEPAELLRGADRCSSKSSALGEAGSVVWAQEFIFPT